MDKHVLVVGQNPGIKPHIFGKSVNGTLNRVNAWMSSIDVEFYSFANVIIKHNTSLSFKNVDCQSWMCYIDWNNVIVICLGNFASKALDRMNIKHFKLPHPSGLNRLLNDKEYEKNILNKCREYIKGYLNDYNN